MIVKKRVFALVLLAMAAGAFGQDADMQAYVTLFKAAETGQTAKVRELIDQGMEANALISVGMEGNSVRFQSLLGAAVSSGTAETVTLLLERGADPNLVAPDGGKMHYPLYYAVKNNSLPILRMLIQAGSGASSQQDALFGIVQSDVRLSMGERHVDRSAVLQELLRRGADVNATDEQGRSPLTYAQWRGHDAYAKILRQAGAREPAPEVLMGTFVYDPATQAKTGTGADCFDSDYTGKLYFDKEAAYPSVPFIYRIFAKGQDQQGRTEYLIWVVYAPNNVWCCRLRFSQDGKTREIDALGQNIGQFPSEIKPQSPVYGIAHRK